MKKERRKNNSKINILFSISLPYVSASKAQQHMSFIIPTAIYQQEELCVTLYGLFSLITKVNSLISPNYNC